MFANGRWYNAKDVSAFESASSKDSKLEDCPAGVA